MPDQSIVNRIRNLMEKSDVTAYKVCKDCSISDGHFAEVMKYYPKRNFTVEQLAKLAKYFGVTTDWLIWGDPKNRDKEIEKLKAEIIRLKKLSSKAFDALKLFNDVTDLSEKYKIVRKELFELSTVRVVNDRLNKRLTEVLREQLEINKDLKSSKK